MSLDFNGYEDIPERTRQTLTDYAEKKWRPGSFVEAVLANDLVDSVARADAMNLQALPRISTFVYNRMPMELWGSRQAVHDYLNSP